MYKEGDNAPARKNSGFATVDWSWGMANRVAHYVSIKVSGLYTDFRLVGVVMKASITTALVIHGRSVGVNIDLAHDVKMYL